MKLKNQQNQEITVLNVHPTIGYPFKKKRAEQVKFLQSEILKSYSKDNLIVTGDMNHFPKSEQVDLDLIKACDLKMVNIGDQTTYPIIKSPYKMFAQIACKLKRQPLSAYNGQLDAILYQKTNFKELKTEILEIPSDHHAIRVLLKV